ncbi:hypothetical protein JCM30237_02600 [Halolamina litorea]|jgi:hypothetical protein|uniref:C2H2-type domain-containing protein n=1 Tax=Halolamina litorea TaxID=1515593 RepID=A0ABD6BSC1_9EURY|nr:DNA-binding protein [Halolamina litorea]
MAADAGTRCRYCGRRFPTERLLALHHGSSHTHEVTDDEWEAVVAAREAEADELRRVRIRMLLALTLCYFGFLLLYATR